MGATSYEVYVAGANPATCFDKAVKDAQHESGHGGYTGTIAEKNGSGFRKYPTGPLPIAAARELANSLMDEEVDEAPLDLTDKWGAANAIPVAPDSAFRTKHKTLYLNVKEEGYLEPVKLAQERMKAATISNVEVLEDKRRTKVESHRAKKRVTEWLVEDRFAHVVGREDTCPKAIALAKRLAGESHDSTGAPAEYTVKGIIVGGGSPHYATYRQVQISRKVRLKVTYVEQVRRDPAPVGWLFFGYASD